MGDVQLTKDGRTVVMPEELVPDAQRNGWQLAGPVRVEREGETVSASSARELGGLLEGGATLESPIAQRRRAQEARLEEEYGSSPVTAGLLGLGSGLSLGGLELLVEGLGSEEQRRMLRETAQRNRKVFTGGQIASAIIPGMAASRAGILARAIRATPAGFAARLAQRAGVGAAEALGARAASIGGRALQLGVEGAVEGAPFAAGQALSDAIIDNKPLSAEALIGSATTGMLLGGGIGAGIGAVGGVLERAAGRRAAQVDEAFARASDIGSPEGKAFSERARGFGEALDEGHDEVRRLAAEDVERLEGGVGRRFQVEEPGALPAKDPAKVDKLQRELEKVQQQLADLDAGKPLTGKGVSSRRGTKQRKLEADLDRMRVELETTQGKVDELTQLGDQSVAGQRRLAKSMAKQRQVSTRMADLQERIGQMKKGAGTADAPAANVAGELEARQTALQLKLDEALAGTPARPVKEGLTREEARLLASELRSQGKRPLVRELAADAGGLEALKQAKATLAEIDEARAGVDGLVNPDGTLRRWSDESMAKLLTGKPEDFRRFRQVANKYHEAVRKVAEAKGATGVLGKLDGIAADLGKMPEAGERFAGMSSVDLIAAANEVGVIDVDDIPVVGPIADLLLKGRLLFHTAPGLVGGVAGKALPRALARGKGGRALKLISNSLQRGVGINVARNSGAKRILGKLMPGFGGKVLGDVAGGLQGSVTGAMVKSGFDDLVGIGVGAQKQALQVEQKIQASVVSFIKAKRASRKIVPSSVRILEKIHFGGASPKQAARGKTPYQKRAAELREAMANPAATEHFLRTSLEPVRQSNPELFDLMYRTAMARLKFLAMKLPRNPGIGNALNGYRDYDPPRHEQMKWARYVAAAEAPMTVLDNLAAGAISPEEVETLQAVYPEIYAATQQFLLQYLPKHADEIPYDRRVQLGILFKMPTDSSMRPEFVQWIQGIYAAEAAKAQEQNPSPGAQRAGAKAIKGETTQVQRLRSI